MSCRGEIGILLERLDSADIAEAGEAQDALLAILRDGKSVSLLAVSRGERRSLNRILRFSARTSWPVFRDVPFVRAVIGAMAVLGDRVSLHHISCLAERCPQPDIRDAARRCLPALERRLDAGRLNRLLLRPAEAMDALRRVLVRPAPSPAPAHLLRPDCDRRSSGHNG